jgi:hypothetical protein
VCELESSAEEEDSLTGGPRLSARERENERGSARAVLGRVERPAQEREGEVGHARDCATQEKERKDGEVGRARDWAGPREKKREREKNASQMLLNSNLKFKFK